MGSDNQVYLEMLISKLQQGGLEELAAELTRVSQSGNRFKQERLAQAATLYRESREIRDSDNSLHVGIIFALVELTACAPEWAGEEARGVYQKLRSQTRPEQSWQYGGLSPLKRILRSSEEIEPMDVQKFIAALVDVVDPTVEMES